MKKVFVLLLLVIACYCPSFACLNGASVLLKDGTILYEKVESEVPYGHDFNTQEFPEGIVKLDSLYKKTGDLDYLSDEGLLLILLKQYDKALKIYFEIEKIEPNRYATASNLGTAYELMGQNEEALKWIKKAVEINPESHEKSEWIHVKILEAKIKGPQFYTTRFLLGTDFGTARLPTATIQDYELIILNSALYFQLNERCSFIKPKDELVAQLLFDLGNISFLLKKYDLARIDYRLAEGYGYAGDLLESRKKEVERMANQTEKTSNSVVEKKGSPNYLFFGIGGSITLVVLIAIFVYRNRRRNRDSY